MCHFRKMSFWKKSFEKRSQHQLVIFTWYSLIMVSQVIPYCQCLYVVLYIWYAQWCLGNMLLHLGINYWCSSVCILKEILLQDVEGKRKCIWNSSGRKNAERYSNAKSSFLTKQINFIQFHCFRWLPELHASAMYHQLKGLDDLSRRPDPTFPHPHPVWFEGPMQAKNQHFSI